MHSASYLPRLPKGTCPAMLAAATAIGSQRTSAFRERILQRDCEGRLVPHDPTDEPASFLLGPMRAERES